MSTAFRVERGGRVVVAHQKGAHREARRIARMIDGYRPPTPLIDRENAFGFTPEQLEGVVSAPPADPSAMDLPAEDRYRLREADHLIAACSGDAEDDRWLDEAIRTFLAHKSAADKAQRLHIVLIPGPSPRRRRTVEVQEPTPEASPESAPEVEPGQGPAAEMPTAETFPAAAEEKASAVDGRPTGDASDEQAGDGGGEPSASSDQIDGGQAAPEGGDEAAPERDVETRSDDQPEPESAIGPDAARELGVAPVANLAVDKDGWRGGGRLIRAAVLGVPPAQLQLMERERQASRLRIGVITVLVTSMIGLTAVVVSTGG